LVVKSEPNSASCNTAPERTNTPSMARAQERIHSNMRPSHGESVKQGLAKRALHCGTLADTAKKLQWSPERLRDRCNSLQTIIASMYRDRIEPTIAEVRHRLCQCGWPSQDSRMVLRLSTNQPDKFVIMPPGACMPIRILLHSPPPWFKGWIVDATDLYSPEVWSALELFLLQHRVTFEDGVHGAALDLRSRAVPSLQTLVLGELRHVIQLALGERDLLQYEGCSIKLSQRLQQLSMSWQATQPSPRQPVISLRHTTSGCKICPIGAPCQKRIGSKMCHTYMPELCSRRFQ